MQLCRINRIKWLKIGHYWYFHHAVYQVVRFSIFLSETSLSALKKSTTKSVFFLRPREYVCLYVCLSVREDISGTTRAIFIKFFVHVAYVCGSVFLRHIDDRPHRLSARKGWGECTARANCNLRQPCLLLVYEIKYYKNDNGVLYPFRYSMTIVVQVSVGLFYSVHFTLNTRIQHMLRSVRIPLFYHYVQGGTIKLGNWPS